MSSVQDAIDYLRARGGSLRCTDLCKTLRAIGFDVREGDGPGHKVVSHPKLVGFHGSNFNCGHGRNPEVGRPYVRNILRVLDEWKTELEEVNNV